MLKQSNKHVTLELTSYFDKPGHSEGPGDKGEPSCPGPRGLPGMKVSYCVLKKQKFKQLPAVMIFFQGSGW